MYQITFKQSPNKWAGRNGYQPIALVNHRMVGYLPGTDATFLNPDRDVSAHFGIGYRTAGGPVRLSQYVDLSDSAWANGNYDPSGGWPLVKKTSTGTVINPNYYTISIEHEDGGPNDGVVTQAVKDASCWLQTILLTGDVDLMRYVGIQIRDSATAAALKTIIPAKETIIDHNRISGSLKPYCWRPYKLDTGGFPAWQPILIEQLRGSKMAIQDTLALLEQQITELENQRNAAVVEAEQSKNKLEAAKTDALLIKAKAQEITVLADHTLAL
jgi:hypothetical protein